MVSGSGPADGNRSGDGKDVDLSFAQDTSPSGQSDDSEERAAVAGPGEDSGNR